MIAGSLDPDHRRRIAADVTHGRVAEHRPGPVTPLMLEIDRRAECGTWQEIERAVARKIPAQHGSDPPDRRRPRVEVLLESNDPESGSGLRLE